MKKSVRIKNRPFPTFKKGLTDNSMTLETLTQIFKSLSEPIRLRIIYLLMQRESLCVCDLVEILQLNQSTVSRHLSYLKNAGMVKAWREGTWMHYALNQETLDPVNLQFIESTMPDFAEIQQDQNRLIEHEKTPRKCTLS